MATGLVGLPFLGGAQGYTQLADGSYAMNLSGMTDPDASAWGAAVVSNGGTYSPATLTAVSNFVASAKASGYWTKLNRINLFCGNQLAACLVPLKVGGGSATETNVNFVGGDYTEATGLTGNGSNKLLRTGLIPSVSLTLNDTHLALYNRASTGNATIGCQMATDDQLYLFAPYVDGKLYSDQCSSAGGRIVTAGVIATPYGFVAASRESAVAHTGYRNAVSLVNNATSGGTLPTVEVYVFAKNANGTPADYGANPLGGYSIGSGLTAGDVTAYNTHMQAFQTALGRQV